MVIIEMKDNLFNSDPSYALAHCVGNDFIMGAGIATEFKRRFGQRDWLVKNSKGIGTALLLENSPSEKWQYVFYLITKPYSGLSKPTYETIKLSLIDMFRQMKDKHICKIAIPRIGCGLDGLKWDIVMKILSEVKPKDVIVRCYYL